MGQITIYIENSASTERQATVWDLIDGDLEPALRPTWIPPTRDLPVEAGNDGRGWIQWLAGNSAGTVTSTGERHVRDGETIDIGT